MKKRFTIFFILAAAAALAGCSRGISENEKGGIPMDKKNAVFSLFSDSFQDNSLIPSEFTCDGRHTRPALRWVNVPAGTKSLALVVRDPDAPSGDFLHWAVVDIPPGVGGFAQGLLPPAPARELANDAGTTGYFGPCPPSGTHRYVFTLYALNAESYAGGQARLEDYLEGRALGKAVLTGLYKRKK
jgi:hypothetical protein